MLNGVRCFDAGVLFSTAVDAADSINAELRRGGQQRALISIVFSVVTIEAFLNEARDAATDWLFDDAVKTFVDFMADAEYSRLESKIALAGWLFSGKRVDKSQQPYQDFCSLVELRNHLVHFKPNPSLPYVFPPPKLEHKLIDKFRSKNILAEDEGRTLPASWIFHFQTKAVAHWCCRTAALTIREFVSKIPRNTSWTTMLEHLEQTHFDRYLQRA